MIIQHDNVAQYLHWKKKVFEAEKWYNYKPEGVLGSESHITCDQASLLFLSGRERNA